MRGQAGGVVNTRSLVVLFAAIKDPRCRWQGNNLVCKKRARQGPRVLRFGPDALHNYGAMCRKQAMGVFD